jgi:hypothetical protein
MLESIFSGSVARTSENITNRDARHALAALVALTEMAAVAASTYVAFAAYHLVVWGGLPGTISYGAICTGLALMYGIVCLTDRQYDFLGAEWNQHTLHRGALALGLAFVFLLAFMFLTGTVTAYSRGTFVAQLALVLPVQITTRVSCGERSKWPGDGVIGARQASSFWPSPESQSRNGCWSNCHPGRKKYVRSITWRLTALMPS